jgi:hypothetical protein
VATTLDLQPSAHPAATARTTTSNKIDQTIEKSKNKNKKFFD